ncbi:hypothetical protein WICPIJ_005811 [Wickerhamomyces pijperi]|uniref:Uncharacterized protein n=1 Tax=Wickerhamomyces pijperi TaxID=599730 RepID=A0A9P8TLG8_WICPI|nr:hypothetical protein WICPIJ_005811 [Wickerhamomyces pijperi]
MTTDSSQRPSLAVYRFSSDFFQTHQLSTIEPFIQTICARINEGYDQIHGKYGYLDTKCPRIEDHRNFVEEFHLLDDAAYILLLVKDPEIGDDEISTKLKSKDVPLVEVTTEEILKYNSLQVHDIIGSITMKPLESTPSQMEPKAFISFFKGAGRFLLEFIEPLVVKENPKVTHLMVQVVVCHELVPLYVKFGYVEYLPRQRQVVKQGVIVEGCMTGVPAHKDFEITWMNKQIRF